MIDSAFSLGLYIPHFPSFVRIIFPAHAWHLFYGFFPDLVYLYMSELCSVLRVLYGIYQQ